MTTYVTTYVTCYDLIAIPTSWRELLLHNIRLLHLSTTLLLLLRLLLLLLASLTRPRSEIDLEWPLVTTPTTRAAFASGGALELAQPPVHLRCPPTSTVVRQSVLPIVLRRDVINNWVTCAPPWWRHRSFCTRLRWAWCLICPSLIKPSKILHSHFAYYSSVPGMILLIWPGPSSVGCYTYNNRGPLNKVKSGSRSFSIH